MTDISDTSAAGSNKAPGRSRKIAARRTGERTNSSRKHVVQRETEPPFFGPRPHDRLLMIAVSSLAGLALLSMVIMGGFFIALGSQFLMGSFPVAGASAPSFPPEGVREVTGGGPLDAAARDWVLRHRNEIHALLALPVPAAPAAPAAVPEDPAARVAAPSPGQPSPGAPSTAIDKARLAALLAEEGSIVSGAGAPALVYFFDFSCIFCQRMVETFDALGRENPAFVYQLRPVAILGEESRLAALAAEGARLQGKGYDFYRSLMAQLKNHGGRPGEKLIETAAREAGLDLERWDRDRAAQQAAARLESDMKAALSLGWTRSTPFAVNSEGTPVTGYLPAEGYRDYIPQ